MPLKENLVLSSRIKHLTLWQRPRNIVHRSRKNIINSRIEPFQFPHVKVEVEIKTATSTTLYPITLLVKKFDQMSPKSKSDYEDVDNIDEKLICSKTSGFQTTKH
jgi:hypothetical protein